LSPDCLHGHIAAIDQLVITRFVPLCDHPAGENAAHLTNGRKAKTCRVAALQTLAAQNPVRLILRHD